MDRGPISRTGCSDPSRGDGESAFALPKDTPSEGSPQGISRPPEQSGGIRARQDRCHCHRIEPESRYCSAPFKQPPLFTSLLSRCPALRTTLAPEPPVSDAVAFGRSIARASVRARRALPQPQARRGARGVPEFLGHNDSRRQQAKKEFADSINSCSVGPRNSRKLTVQPGGF